MSEGRDPYIPSIPEVDQHGGDELPSYNDLAVQNGPNSRFGRWRAWIEKRAAERYTDLTPEALEQRRQKGWGAGSQDRNSQPPADFAGPSNSNRPGLALHIQTDIGVPDTPPGLLPEPDGPQPSVGEVLSPTRLQLHQFGSRFLPHTSSPIRCLLPVLGDNMLLIGHDDGLSVLNMFPKEWSDEGLDEKGPNEAEAHHILKGEGFYQMTLLESESTGDGTPQGVVLALVGQPADSARDQEGIRAIRMYNLASLVSLTKWAVVQPPGTLPLHLGSLEVGRNSLGRHHKSKQGLARGLKHLRLENPSHSSGRPLSTHAPYPSAGTTPSLHSRIPLPGRAGSHDSAVSVDSSWDVIEDLPLRWAADFVPLASPGTRLHGTPVLFYDMWRDPNERNRGVAYLAVVVKTNILLYHAPKGERAFRFVKVAVAVDIFTELKLICCIGILHPNYCTKYHVCSASGARVHGT
ncbi:hypothetical protein PHLGIDRAFT_177949 [Phlebiopsis gigantea 11061_1 CR5-6]|uniref:Uncharacterized protein n=1 Tax=Phlebiopsis gigantea (strain 11061_1 CR5-6) TaxID=745531 RepID=A0A0C3RUW5_PHLG1|nr:hypothetical protein PHLGIDRAFT_177949 [Phlebiopsis gigantea 11061_1 CR5-6]